MHRALAAFAALLGMAGMMACDRISPVSPTSSVVSSALMSPGVVAVGDSVQESSAQAFLLFDGSLTQLSGLAAAQDSGSSTTVRTIDWSTACRDGGTRGISGTVTVTRGNGSGSVQTDLELSFTNCDVGKVTLQGNPGISLKGQTTFVNGIPDTHTFQKVGGLLFTVEGGSQGSVQFNCTVTWSRQSGVVSTSGTVSWEYPIGTPVAGPGCRG